MKINTMLKYDFVGDVYIPRIQSTGSETVYVLFAENQAVPMSIVSNRQTITMFTEKPVELGSRLLQVRNPEGRMLFVEGLTGSQSGEEEYDVYVHAVLPVVDIYGTITGYRSTLRRPQPTLTNVKTMTPEDEALVL